MERKHYEAIDGLRVIACIGLLIMHIRANSNYAINGFIYNTVIASFTNFVFFFMMISAFGMCCGYYEKIVKGQFDLTEFYKKRFIKIFPFFGVLVLLEMVLNPSVSSMYEAFADLTLMFGFLPNGGHITVIGVGWFIGTIFVFYLVFPFFSVLLENRKRAWTAFVISLVYNYACTNYFNVGRQNILYSGCFFIAGGLIYLYRKEIGKCNKWIGLIVTVTSVFIYYLVDGNAMACLFVSAALLSHAIILDGEGQTILENRMARFISSISMEIYLSHMVIFRILEKIGVTSILGNGWLQYVVTSVLVLAGAGIYSIVLKKVIETVEDKLRLGRRHI